MADVAELLERCAEEIAATVLDAGKAMSYRTLGASSHVNADVSRQALRAFVVANADTVGAIEVAVETTGGSGSSSDPRARVIRVGSLSPAQDEQKAGSRQIYGVFKKSAGESAAAGAVVACWAQERAMRNDIFEKAGKQAPLSRAIKAFYESGIACIEATTRTGFGESQGEESVSVFDSVKAVARKPVSSSSTSGGGSGNSASALASKNGSKSFFKSTAGATTSAASKARASGSASAKATPVKQFETMKIDAKSMSNVFTIDSDEDDDGSDADAPVFVKKARDGRATGATARSKRVISDDEDDDEDDIEASAPAATSSKADKSHGASSSSSSKRKLAASSSDEKRSATASESEDGEQHSSKRTKRGATSRNEAAEKEDEEEDESAPAVATKRRVEVIKTRINEQGYMVTEKSFEEVEVTAEEVEQERQQAAKRKKQEQAAAAAAKAAAEAKVSAAEKKAGGKSTGAAAKQKNLFAFFQRK
ncbi:hypothetical protein PybrP1_003765 [[Pythium] brassicae (nom. inval.)]|nr:hypothetical protein PybrP1_003765 [[Pythium] brassicae (nom. inval.)]